MVDQDGARVEARVAELMGRMGIEDMLGQMVQLPADRMDPFKLMEECRLGSFLHCPLDLMDRLQEKALSSGLGIPLLFGIDAIHGNCFFDGATVFPSQLAMAQSWDTGALEAFARVAAHETRSAGIHWTFSPVLCLARDPRWGRCDESFGEDPFLAGALGEATVRGYQGRRLDSEGSVLACAKHFAAYGESYGGRDSCEAEVSKRAMHSIFLPPFERVAKAGCASLMAGYQAVDGLPCSANPWLLRKTAKEAWGWDGFIVTDWNNVGNLLGMYHLVADWEEAAALAIEAGNDMIMTTPEFYPAALGLLRSGRLDQGLVRDACARILRAKFRLGLFDGLARPKKGAFAASISRAEHKEENLRLSRLSISLLKNEAAPIPGGRGGFLPLPSLGKGEGRKRLCLCGPAADSLAAHLGDWSFGSTIAPWLNDTMHKAGAQCLRQALEERAHKAGWEITYAAGCHLRPEAGQGPKPGQGGGDGAGDGMAARDEAAKAEAAIDEALLSQALAEAAGSDAIMLALGDVMPFFGEFHDCATLELPGAQTALAKALAGLGKPIILVYMASKPYAIADIAAKATAILCSFNPGQLGGKAIAQAIFGDFSPSGSLSISFPRHVGQLPVHYMESPGWHAPFCPLLNAGRERYVDMDPGPLFAFGEGLSYSRFELGQARLELSWEAKGAGGLSLFIPLRNSGAMGARRNVQVYLRDEVASVTLPRKRLVGFAWAELAAGEETVLRVDIGARELSLVGADMERRVEAGDFCLLYGFSSRDQELKSLGFRLEPGLLLEKLP